MSRTPLCVLFVGLAAACCSDPPPPAAAQPPTTAVRTGTTMTPAERAMQAIEEQKKKSDTDSKGLLKSFQTRTYDPRRDGLLEHAEGTIEVTTSGGQAVYRFVFDSTYPDERPVRFETVSEPADVGSRTMIDVRNWANQACLGAFVVVVYYWPPIPLSLLPATDGSKDLVVLAGPFKTLLSVSYRFDERQVVVSRGEWTDEHNRFATNYFWDFFHGRYFLRTANLFQGATTEFEYDDSHGVNLLSKVHVKSSDRPLEVKFKYDVVRRRPK